jgi:hypothetical protein
MSNREKLAVTKRFVGLLVFVTGVTWFATTVSQTREEILSFDMWCLEMQLYPATRCDTRRPQDMKDYERYRASVERYQQERAVRDKREKAIEEKLNSDPLSRSRDASGVPTRSR